MQGIKGSLYGVTRYFGTNHLGSTTLLTDANGDILMDVETTPFGEQEDKSLFFTGKQWDEDAELYYFNQRWMNPDTGRFITEDPIRDGLLWAAYVNNNPMMYIDPTGLTLRPGYGHRRSSDDAEDDPFNYKIERHLQELDPSVYYDSETETFQFDEDIDINGFEDGHELLRRIIEDDAIIEILAGNDTVYDFNADNYDHDLDKFVEGKIYVNLETAGLDFSVQLPNNKRGTTNTRASNTIGHELIHAERELRGVSQQDTMRDFKLKPDGNITFYGNESVHKDELPTVGIGGNRKGDITENMLRTQFNNNIDSILIRDNWMNDSIWSSHLEQSYLQIRKYY